MSNPTVVPHGNKETRQEGDECEYGHHHQRPAGRVHDREYTKQGGEPRDTSSHVPGAGRTSGRPIHGIR